MKKAISLGVAAAMAATLLAGCGTAASSAAASSEAASTADSATAESTAASEAAPSEAHEINTTDPIELTISWWGGDSRHEAYQKALEAFHEKYPNITVSPTYGAWSGWEEKQSTALAADQGSDVMQVNWNWLYQYSPTGEKFVDLREYSDIIDLSQWSDTAKNACTVADSLQAVPISMTGRIFYWNMNTFKQAGIEQVPASYDDLIAAGKAFQEKLGDDYYPLAIGQYDRMILMTFYLESKYGKAWVENNECQYSEEEVVDGLNFIDSLEDNHVIPTRPTMIAAGFDSIDKSQEWIDGKYAGIFEWDSAPSKYQSALADNSGFTVGEEIKFGDKANGGFSKVSMGMAITKSCQHPVEAAALIDFLWNGDGAAIMGSECGIPASTAGLASAQAADAVKPLVLEANTKVLAFVDMPLDPYYESSKLKDTTDALEAAASELTDVEYTVPDYHFEQGVYDKRVYNGWGHPEPDYALKFGPNIKDWPEQPALTDDLLVKIVSYITDPVTTTDELIPSGETSSFRSNPLRLAEFTLSRKDPAYVPNAKAVKALDEQRKAGELPAEVARVYDDLKKLGYAPDAANTNIGSAIFANKPGDGSAREQAASCQRVLGACANIAKEYATKRYRSNCINWGMLPFTLDEGTPFEYDDCIYLPGVRKALLEAADTMPAVAVKPDGSVKEFTVKLGALTDAERQILADGCLINYYKNN